ncbi:MAG: phosphate ABC transporter ATP-binding protein, partial [Ilumatobacter sp.]
MLDHQMTVAPTGDTAVISAPAVFSIEAMQVMYGSFTAVRDITFDIPKNEIT